MTHLAPVPELYVSPEAAAALGAEAAKLPAWTLDAAQRAHLILLMNGAFAPLRGYMTEAEWRAVPEGPWPVPLALQVSAGLADRVQPGDDIALRDDGGVLAVMSVTDRWGEPPLLGGRVKGLRCVPGGPSPNDLRALLRDRGAEWILSVQPTHPDQVATAAQLAQDLDALLLVQPFPGVAVEAPTGAIVAPLLVNPPDGQDAPLWQAMVARNHGATHLMLDKAVARERYRPHRNRIGLEVVGPNRMV